MVRRPLIFVVGFVLFTLTMGTLWASGAATARAATPTDVVFLFDTSGSMAGELGEAAAEMQAVMTHIDSVVSEVDYGVAEVRDYPGSIYDEFSESDEPWRLITPLTSNRAAVTASISTLFAGGGGDSPEAYGRALWETDTNPTVGWRPGARHAIVLIADQVPHMPNVDAGMPEALWLEPAPWDTGEELPGTWGIPGTQLLPGPGTEFLAVLHQLAGDGKPLEMVDYHETEANYIHYWEYWAGLAGGVALEAGGGGKELSGKLISLIEAAAPPCATAATPTEPSPHPPSTLPAALTGRFGLPGTKVTIVPAAGFRFCPGEHPVLGGVSVTSLEESTPSQMAFQVPPTAVGGLALSSSTGSVGAVAPYEVDNFRWPWGMSLVNEAGNGGSRTYDGQIDVSEEDLNSVYGGLGPAGSSEYKLAKSYARGILGDGLCYGFSLISQALYGDSHGPQHYPLSWASSKGFGLQPNMTPYSLHETASGSHAVTHALLRAALSQDSPAARKSWQEEKSASSVKSDLDTAFGADQPAMLLIHYHGEGHALLAFDYQSPDPTTGEGIAVDVVDPNVPWVPGRPASDYEQLQVHVKSNGSWHFNGTFSAVDFGDPKSGSPGSLQVATAPPMPGGLSVLPSSSSGSGVSIRPEGGDAVSAISYSDEPGHDIPDDVEPERVYADARPDGLVVPAGHQTVTATIKSKSGKTANATMVGPGFIDTATIPTGDGAVTVSGNSGAIGAPAVSAGTTLSATTVSGEVQHRATVTFSGRVKRPRVTVSQDGGVTVTAAGGTGKATVKLSAFSPDDESHSPRQVVQVEGPTKLHRHTPKVNHRKHHHPHKKHSKHHK
jgi:hypothetical protein